MATVNPSSHGDTAPERVADEPVLDVDRRDEVASQVHLACRQAAAGKRATQLIARWAQAISLSESEFRLLWLLTRGGLVERGADNIATATQRCLAEMLAVSPAQLSACVVNLTGRGLIQCTRNPSDRRRQLCSATSSGWTLIDDTLLQLDPTALNAHRKGAAA